MIKIGVTGNKGFLGRHLVNTINLEPEKYSIVQFERDYFEDTSKLDAFVSSCDVIYHLAAMNRHEDQQIIYNSNITLVKTLISALERTGSIPSIYFSSSTQKDQDNLYGKSKKVGQQLLQKWGIEHDARVVSFVIPNVFGAFGKPFYNSFIATFCHLLTTGGSPTVENDSEVSLIYVHNLVKEMLRPIGDGTDHLEIEVDSDIKITVKETLRLLENYKDLYFDNGVIPNLPTPFELNLFNTYRSFINHESYFPRLYTEHSDERGSFVELIRLQQGGQVSFSTTVPNITRGNHYHTRKIERFSVIKGEARIEMRKIDNTEVLTFDISGDQPSYVDIPIWYTHNIKNTGNEELYTIFWINEFYNPTDADTFFVEV
ncbi:polysaccharide biosynthesis C-terminal domain-containing protein [Dokdonia donghaensis]|uniref:Epimerase n=1 Tax=Dokdonia donghaensis DSW-1 TaxID=1300343 RepID=A0A0A2GZ39_9FLAO|nr:NAD-dependent epimerase/dehydratase family protein [Dokdonia donghaensis]ANH61080.1 NAD dependent epimerase/dehydratase family protein [Dokdonia donghaensis DSW-1]KGO05700.1 epimerase [Dokdonia donghaensis DSW-1]